MCGPGSEKTKEEQKALWFERGVLVAPYESDLMVCLMRDPNTQMEDGNSSTVVDDETSKHTGG